MTLPLQPVFPALTNVEEPGTIGDVMDLQEYQCRGDCEGRSFWV